MSRTDGKPYHVGYGRPPQRTRWKKGQSGNPRHKEGKVREGTVAHSGSAFDASRSDQDQRPSSIECPPWK